MEDTKIDRREKILDLIFHRPLVEHDPELKKPPRCTAPITGPEAITLNDEQRKKILVIINRFFDDDDETAATDIFAAIERHQIETRLQSLQANRSDIRHDIFELANCAYGLHQRIESIECTEAESLLHATCKESGTDWRQRAADMQSALILLMQVTMAAERKTSNLQSTTKPDQNSRNNLIRQLAAIFDSSEYQDEERRAQDRKNFISSILSAVDITPPKDISKILRSAKSR